MAEMKGITCCGDCAYYNFKQHKCTRCNSIESDKYRHFYEDCPLPDVVKLGQIEWKKIADEAPEPFDDVLIFNAEDRDAGVRIMQGWAVRKATHWMPLPNFLSDTDTRGENND